MQSPFEQLMKNAPVSEDVLKQFFEVGKQYADFTQRAQQIALRHAQNIQQKQTAAIRETYDELSSLYREVDWSTPAPELMAHQKHCAQSAMKRALEHMRVSINLVNDTTESTLKLAEDALEETIENSMPPAESNKAEEK